MPTITRGEDTKILVSPTEAGRLLDISRQYVYTLVARGDLDAVNIGRSRKITLASVERLAAQGTSAA